MKISRFEIIFDIIVLVTFWFGFGIDLTSSLNGNYINGDFIAQLVVTITCGFASIISIFVVYFDFKKLLKHIKWLENKNDNKDEVKK